MLLQALYCWGLTILFLANVGAVTEPWLVIADWIAAVYFALVGAVAGWVSARSAE